MKPAFHPSVRVWRAVLLSLLLTITLLALIPAPPPAADTGWDKLNHLLAFGALALCVCMAQPTSWRWRAMGLGGLLAYGASIEVLQRLTPTRQGEWADLLADALGIALGTLLGLAWLRLRARAQARRALGAGSRAKP